MWDLKNKTRDKRNRLVNTRTDDIRWEGVGCGEDGAEGAHTSTDEGVMGNTVGDTGRLLCDDNGDTYHGDSVQNC